MITIIYCRKSMEDDNRQILSIGSQESEMRKLAERFGLKIDKVYQESMTAKAPGRPIFAEMMNFVERQKNCVILVWKLDRLARNPVDEGKIKWLLQQGVIQQIKTPDRDYSPNDNALIASVEFGMANQYIRDLRQNVLRGNRAKLERGGWPNMAPFGYSNNKADRSIVVNPETAPIVQKIFTLYASGKYTLQGLAETLSAEGIRTKGGKKISRSNIHTIIRNPFYYGVMVKDGVYYPGKYELLISRFLFDEANDVLLGKNHPRQKKHAYPLRGFMSCAVCGCALTASLQKKKYLYYYCTNGKGVCTQRNKHLKADDAYLLISNIFQFLKTDERLLEIAAKASEERYHTASRSRDSVRQSLVKRLSAIQEQQDILVRKKDTPEDVYARNMTALRNEQVDIEIELSKVDTDSRSTEITFEQVKKVFLDANNIAKTFLHADAMQKRKFAESVLSNVLVKDNLVEQYQFKKPYQTIAELPKNPSFSELCSILELVRTHFAACGGEEFPPRKFGKAAEPHR